MYKHLTLLLVFIFSSHFALSQSKNSSASFYGSYGLGTLNQSMSGTGEALGLNGVAFDYLSSANFSNPSLLSFYANTTALGTIEQSTYTGTQNGASSSYSDFNARDLGLIFPIDKGKLSLSTSLNTLSYVNYRGQQSQTLLNDTTLIVSEFSGTGGLNSLQLGVGYAISKYVSIGYSPSFIFGSIKHDMITAFQDYTYSSTLQGLNTYYSGFAHEFGVIFHKNELRSKYDRLVLGATFKLSTDLSTRLYQKATIISSGSEQPITTELNKGTTKFPFSVKVGATYYWNRNWITATDILYENWSSTNAPSASYSYNDRLRIGGGFMYAPELRSSTGFFSTVSLKLGASLDTGYLNIQSNSISKISLHGGFSIPSPYSLSSIDLNFEYGRLGTTNNSLVQENIFTMKLVINLSEFMFFKRQLQ
ncbi:hypothetical protein EP331_03885 [bacterium]|nr:MAG: hypothetical protein EP331_03885 [bacterium]